MKEKGHKISRPSLKSIIFGSSKTELEASLISQENISPDITHRRIDLCEMIYVILGLNWKKLYLLLFFVYATLSLVSYTVIFSTSLTSNVELGFLHSCDIYESQGFDECRKTYWFFLAILSGIVIYLTLIEMHEQKLIQNILTGLTLFNVVLVIVISIVIILTETKVDSSEHVDSGIYKMTDIYNIGTSVPILLFASIYQTSLPSIIENIGNKSVNIRKILIQVLCVAFVCYMSMGLIVPWAIPNVKGQYNISYRHYSAGYSQDDAPWWALLITYFVVLFPSIGILSSFPLMAIPLTHNLISFFYGYAKSEGPRLGEYGIKVFCVLLPLLIAFFEYNLVNSI